MHKTLNEQYGHARTPGGIARTYQGEIELIFRSTRTGKVLKNHREHNLVKIFAKEIISHRIPHTKVWDPNAGSGAGAWVASGIDPDEDFAAKYILFGASFDDDGAPLDTADGRFYKQDPITGGFIPISLGVGAEYDGGLVNAVPIAEPGRPLKKVERIFFEPTYQPAGTPLLQDDVRAMNNVLVMETTLRKEEYNGFGLTSSDFFTISEIALAGGKELDSVGACECPPKDVFLEGRTNGTAITVTANGTSTVTIDPGDAAFVDVIKEGDQVKLVDANETAGDSSSLDLITPHFLVTSKSVGGSDIVLDRDVVDSNNDPITGQVGIFRDTLRIFSPRS
jgi:hypothetical protein